MLMVFATSHFVIAGAKNTKAQTAVDTGFPGKPNSGSSQSCPKLGVYRGAWIFSRNPGCQQPNHLQYGRDCQQTPPSLPPYQDWWRPSPSDIAPGLSAAMLSPQLRPAAINKTDKNAAFERLIWPGPGICQGVQVRHQMIKCRCAAVVIQLHL